MANRPSRLVVSIPRASRDGRFYGPYPNGDASAVLAGAAVSAALAAAALGSGAPSFTHGSSFTITGSGFGTKYLAAPIFDNCKGSNPSTLWPDGVQPSASTQGSTWNMAYRACPFQVPAGASPAGPAGFLWEHPNVIQTGLRNRGTNLVAGGSSGNSAFTQYDNLLSRTFTAPAYPYYTLLRWWEGLDATYPDNQRNFKYFDFARDSWFEGSANWYMDYQNGGVTSTSTPEYEINSDGGGISGTGGGWSQPTHLFPPHALGHSPRNAWVLREVWILHASAGVIYVLDENVAGNQLNPINTVTDGTTSLSTIDGWAGTTRAIGPIGYNDPPSGGSAGTAYGCWRPRTDIFLDVDNNQGLEVYAADNSSWAAATYREIQPWTAWADGSISFNVNGGRIASGTSVWIHVRKPPWVSQSDAAAYGPYILLG